MRHFISLVVVFMVCMVCKAVEPQKIAVSELLMKFSTKIEQIHNFYSPGDFVINKNPCDCEPMKAAHSISVRGDRLSVDGGTEDELSFKVISCTYEKGKVFADRGEVETYILSCSELDDDIPSKSISNISIQKVKDGARSKTIISIPRYDSDGVIYQNMILQD